MLGQNSQTVVIWNTKTGDYSSSSLACVRLSEVEKKKLRFVAEKTSEGLKFSSILRLRM